MVDDPPLESWLAVAAPPVVSVGQAAPGAPTSPSTAVYATLKAAATSFATSVSPERRHYP